MKKELEKILEDKGFVKELILKETREEAKKAIEEKGVSVTDEEIEEIYKLYSSIYEECKKMSKEDLDKIAGGDGKGLKQKIIDFWYGDAASRHTGGFLNNQEVKKYSEKIGGAVVGLGTAYLEHRHEENMLQGQVDVMREQNRSKEIDSRDYTTTLAVVGVGVLTVAGLAHTFKDEIKSWIHKK